MGIDTPDLRAAKSGRIIGSRVGHEGEDLALVVAGVKEIIHGTVHCASVASLPGLTRGSILLPGRWTRGASPRMTATTHLPHAAAFRTDRDQFTGATRNIV